MLDDPFAGRAPRVPGRSRLLVATEDGVFLWPGVALVYRQGDGFFAAEPRAVNSALGCLFGPSALDLPMQSALERARDELRCGRVAAVQMSLDRLALPSVWRNGVALIRSIAQRQNLLLPNFVEASESMGTVWTERDIDTIAALYDGARPISLALAKVFNPALGADGAGWDSVKHPRWPRGEPDGGEFRSGDGSSGGLLIPVAGKGPPPPWHNGPPEPLGEPPKIPSQEPVTLGAKYQFIKAISYWLAQAAKLGPKITPKQLRVVIAVWQGAK